MSEFRVCIDVDDVDRAVAFYTQGLGLTVSRRHGSEWVELGGGPAPLDLLPRAAATPATPTSKALRDYARHWTPVHLDFVVPDLDDALRRAERAGARLERTVQERRWGRMANLSDPFGHGICLVEFRGAGYDEVLAE